MKLWQHLEAIGGLKWLHGAPLWVQSDSVVQYLELRRRKGKGLCIHLSICQSVWCGRGPCTMRPKTLHITTYISIRTCNTFLSPWIGNAWTTKVSWPWQIRLATHSLLKSHQTCLLHCSIRFNLALNCCIFRAGHTLDWDDWGNVELIYLHFLAATGTSPRCHQADVKSWLLQVVVKKTSDNLEFQSQGYPISNRFKSDIVCDFLRKMVNEC